ncbi:hypothetical protein P0082_06475 [Candidatus Haliotispira prima]|uniref:Extracellular solute-binding protein n=1 Tax=Candidatus Haliotispira prima TaxID=3034016 RepID=A0ABY8ME64_9SPIO|nr:hypothetical protein P0082_06475 [Candidatus Haliotispira prima]
MIKSKIAQMIQTTVWRVFALPFGKKTNNVRFVFKFVLSCLILVLILAPVGGIRYERAAVPGERLAALEAKEITGPELELQLNSEFWRLLSGEELELLAELRREGGSVRRVVPLEHLYPQLRSMESIDSRNSQGELLGIEVRDLSRSYLQIGQNGALTLVVAGEIQQNPWQLNIYGEPWPPATLRIWMEENFERPFLLSELETYRRFHNLEIEVRVVKSLVRALGQVVQKSTEQLLPDMILADRKTMAMLRGLLQNVPTKESKEENTLAYLELFTNNEQYYSSSLALEPYSLIYNTKLLELSSPENPGSHLRLSDLFGHLETLSAKNRDAGTRPYFLAFGDDSMPISLLLYSFLQSVDFSKFSFESRRGLDVGLQYLREQGGKGLLRRIDYTEERFAKGDIAVMMSRTGNLSNILSLAKTGSGGQNHIQMAKLPYNDLSGNDMPEYSGVWGLSILRDSKVKPQAEGLRRYLLRGAVQGRFDLRLGILPSNTVYYPFYQGSAHYGLLPKGELRYTMSKEELWEHGIERRNTFRRIEELDRLFRDRISLLLKSNIGLDRLLGDMQQQWEQEVVEERRLLFLR